MPGIPHRRLQEGYKTELAVGHRSPRTRSPGSTSRARATRRMLWRLRLRWPRSTWPMNVQCSSDWSARASWDSPNCWRRARTRAPNSPAAGEMGGLGEVAGTWSSQRSQLLASRDYVSQANMSYAVGRSRTREVITMGGC